MSTTTAAPSADAVKRQEAIKRYEAALELAKAASTKDERNKANGALSGPRQAIRNAEARMFANGESFEPYVAETVRKSSVFSEEEAKAQMAKLATAWKRATGQFEYLRATYEPQIERCLKAAKEHGIKLADPRKS